MTADFTKANGVDVGLSAPEMFDYRDRAGVFTAISGIWPINANVTGGDRPERVEVLLTDTNYFQILGTKPQVGRLYDDARLRPRNRRSRRALRRILAAPVRRGPERDRQAAAHRRRPLHDRRRAAHGLPPPGTEHRDRRRGLGAVRLAGQAVPRPQPPRLLPPGRARAPRSRRHARGRAKASRRARRHLRREFPGDYPEHRRLGAPRLEPLQDDLVGPAASALRASRRRRAGASDRLRQRRESAPRAGLGPPPGDRGAPGAGRRTRPLDPPASDREPRHRSLRRSCSASSSRRQPRPARAVPSGRDASPARDRPRRARSRLRRRSVASDRAALRAVPRPPDRRTGGRLGPRRESARRLGPPRQAHPLSPGRGRVRPRRRAAGRRRPARPHVLEPAPGGHGLRRTTR